MDSGRDAAAGLERFGAVRQQPQRAIGFPARATDEHGRADGSEPSGFFDALERGAGHELQATLQAKVVVKRQRIPRTCAGITLDRAALALELTILGTSGIRR